MTRPKKPESISRPLWALVGKKSYDNFKKVALNSSFLNKSLRSMSKKELLAYIGYLVRLYGITGQQEK